MEFSISLENTGNIGLLYWAHKNYKTWKKGEKYKNIIVLPTVRKLTVQGGHFGGRKKESYIVVCRITVENPSNVWGK